MRLFVAVWPSPAVVRALEALPRPPVAGLRWTAPEQWHVTLRFLGEADATAAAEALGAVGAAAVGPVVAALGPATERFGRRVLHAPVAGLEGVAAAVATATAGIGEPEAERPFQGHVTLARARPRGGVDLAGVSGVAVAGSWPVPEVTLVASRLGAGGSRYEVVAAVPLTPPGAAPS